MRMRIGLWMALSLACACGGTHETASVCAPACNADLTCDAELGCLRVCEGFRDVNTREELEALIAEQCGVITGYLTILGTEFNPPLTDLAGLNTLRRVGQHLSIFYHDALINLNGLDGLSSVGDYVYISGNRWLETLSGLDNLKDVAADFSITNNQSLSSLNGLHQLRSIGDFLEVGYNYALPNLNGLETLSHVGGHLNIDRNGVTSLAPLHSWPRDTVQGELRVFGNFALPACEVQRLDAHLDADCPTAGDFQCIGNDGVGTCN